MDMDEIISYIEDIQEAIDQMDHASIQKVIQVLHDARLNNQHVFVVGNGGSAATASHFVCDLAKNTRVPGCPDMRAIGLVDNMTALSAYANEEGYDQVFARQLRNFTRPEDVLVAISTSGNSPNVLNAVETANQMGAITIGFTGRDGGKLGTMVQIEVRVPNQFADQVEDVHLIVAHLISRSLKQLAQPTVVMIPQEQTYDAGILPVPVNDHLPVSIEGTKRKPTGPLNWPPELIENPGCGLGALLLHLVANFSATSGSFLLLDEKGKIIDSAVAYTGRLQSPECDRIARFLNSGLAGWVVEHQVGTLVANTGGDSRWLPTEGESTPRSRSVLCAPLVKSDRVTGVVALTRPGSVPFSDGDLAILISSSRDLYDVLTPCEQETTAGD